MLYFYLARLNLSKKLYVAIPEKKSKQGVEDMEFPSRGTDYINRMRKFLGSVQIEVEFAGVIQKKTCGIPWILAFGRGKSNGCNPILWNFNG